MHIQLFFSFFFRVFSELKISRWLDAHLDRSAGLNTLPKNAILSNVAGDGENRLVITDLKLKKDMKCRLKVYKGTVVTTDTALPDVPSSIISFYHDRLNPRTPGKKTHGISFSNV